MIEPAIALNVGLWATARLATRERVGVFIVSMTPATFNAILPVDLAEGTRFFISLLDRPGRPARAGATRDGVTACELLPVRADALLPM